jgi:phosphotriesterase-related protein
MPILIGGGGEKVTLRIVAKHADHWNCWGGPRVLARKGKILDDHCATLGRDPKSLKRSANMALLITDNKSEVEQLADTIAKRMGRHAADARDTCLARAPDQIREQLHQLQSAKVDTLFIPSMFRRSTSAATSTGSSWRSRRPSGSRCRPLAGQVQTYSAQSRRARSASPAPRASPDRLQGDVREPAAASDKGRAWEPVSLGNLGWVRQNFNANLDNLRLLDEQVAQDEILLFKHAGGRTVVDPTPRTIGRDPLALARIARATGLNVVMGAGYYVNASHPADMDRRTVDELAREMIADVTSGVGETGVRAGLIGEIGTTYPWTENERKVLRAAIITQRETGAPLMIHPGRHPDMPMQLAEFIRKEGGELRRTIMCHICRTISDIRAVIDLAQTGIWLEYDLFGMENSFYPYNPSFDMPNDGGRMAHVLALIDAGHRGQILMSHDIAYKTSLVKWRLRLSPPARERGARLRAKGVDDLGLTRLLVENPGPRLRFFA